MTDSDKPPRELPIGPPYPEHLSRALITNPADLPRYTDAFHKAIARLLTQPKKREELSAQFWQMFDEQKAMDESGVTNSGRASISVSR